MPNKDLELALRVRTEFENASAQLDKLGQDVGDVGEAAQTSSAKLGALGESADEQTARIRAMVAASLEQQNALTAVESSTREATAAAAASSSEWRDVAAAQTAAMNAHRGITAAQDTQAAAARKSTKTIQDEAAALAKLVGEIDPVVRELDRLDDMERRLRAARQSGRLGAEDFDLYNAKLQENRARLTQTTRATNAAALTAGQYRQAMRQLPAQITDVTTSLASGMPIWLVAVQQGGQIKDSFGGIGGAARALTSLITPLTVAIAGATGVVAALALAYKQGSDEASAYNRALILSGNTAGATADSLADMARRIDDVAGTQNAAADALAEVAGRGRFTAEQIEQIGRSAELMRIATGRAVSEVVDEFEELAKDPVDAITKLNEKYNFLTLAVYNQIEALQDQGDQAGAAALAIDAYSEASDNMAAKLNENLGSIERGWARVKQFAAEAWDEMLSVGREATLDELREQLDEIDRRIAANPASAQAYAANRAAIVQQIGEREEEQRIAKREAAEQRIQNEAIKAQREIDRLRDQTLTKAEKREKAIAEYRKNVEKINAAEPGSVSAEQIERDIANIEAKFKDAKTATTDNTFANLNKQLTERIALLAAAADAETKLTEAQRFAEKVQATLADGTVKLTAAQRQAIDARLKDLDAADKVAQQVADAKLLADVQTQYLRAIGDNQAVAEAQIEKRYGELLKRLEARGDQAGIAMVKGLINAEQAAVEVQELQREINRVLNAQSREEQSIQTQIQAGLITEADARQRIVNLSQQTADKLDKLRPQLQELAKMPGDVGEAARVTLSNLDAEAETLRRTTSLLGETLRVSFEDGLAGALNALATGASNLREALQGLLDTVINALSQFAAEQLSQQIVAGIGGLFGAGGNQAAELTEGAAAVAASATALGAASTGLITGAAAIEAAAISLAAANGTSGVSSGGSSSGSSDTGWVNTIANIASLFVADGGHIRGPGTDTSDSIPAMLSNYEYVTRATVVRQPGALPFLHDFNRYGMQALAYWGERVRHATGGLAGVPAPDLPAPSLASTQLAAPAAGNTTQKTDIALHMYDDPQRIADNAFNSRQGQEAFFVMLSKDPGKVRSVLGINGG